LIGDEQSGYSLRRPPVPDLLIALNRPCCERRTRYASRVVWSSCRNFGVISRNLGHGPTAYAAADIVTRRDSQKFRENSSLRCFAGGGRQFRNKFRPGGLSRGSDFSQTAIPPGSGTGLAKGLAEGSAAFVLR
jgi:hypothetical protein